MADAAGVRVVADGPVRHLVLDRPPLNIIDTALVDQLQGALNGAERDAGARVVVMRGEGKCFSAGAEVREHLPGKVERLVREFDDLAIRMEGSRLPIVASVHGACLGGGCELALSADLAIAADDAVFGQPEVKLGVFPPVAVARFPGNFGAKVAADLVLTGRRVPADEALRMGLVSRVVPRAILQEEALATAREIAAAGPQALRLAKRVLNARPPEQDRLRLSEETYLRDLMSTPEPEEGLKAFLEKRTPGWADRTR